MPDNHAIDHGIHALGESRLHAEKGFQAVAGDISLQIDRIVAQVARAGPDSEWRVGSIIHTVRTPAGNAILSALATIDATIATEIASLETVQADESPSAVASVSAQTHPDLQVTPTPAVVPNPPLQDDYAYADVSHLPVHPSTVDVTTPRQGELADCYFFAAMGAVAAERPELLTQGVIDHGDRVTVTFSGNAVTLEKTLPTDEKQRLRFGTSPDGSTMAAFVEKAHAHWNGGYPDIDHGGFPDGALAWLTGQPATVQDVNEQMPDRQMRELCAAARPTVANSISIPDGDPRGETAKKHNVIGWHIYTVKGVDENGDILLHNPWGFFHPEPLPPAVFRELYSHLAWCD